LTVKAKGFDFSDSFALHVGPSTQFAPVAVTCNVCVPVVDGTIHGPVNCDRFVTVDVAPFVIASAVATPLSYTVQPVITTNGVPSVAVGAKQAENWIVELTTAVPVAGVVFGLSQGFCANAPVA
jgi:hypothetical protein